MSLAIRIPVLALLMGLPLVSATAAQDPPAYQFSFGEFGTGDGQLNHPRSVSIHGNEVYVLELSNQRVSVFDLEGTFLRNWGEAGSGEGQIFQPCQLLVTPDREVYISDFQRHIIQVFDADGGYLRQWGGLGAADSLLNYPYGMDADADGNIWVADRGNKAIKKFTPEGVHLQTVKTPEVNGCTDVVITSDTIYGSMWGNSFSGIRRWDLAGNYIGQSTNYYSRTDGIDMAPNGDLYASSSAPIHRIQVREPLGLTLVTEWGGFGAGDAQLANPYDVAVSAAGAIYIALDGENAVKVYSYTTAVEPTTWGRIKRQFR